jgi:transcriptional regulator with XRE-family HTH domain
MRPDSTLAERLSRARRARGMSRRALSRSAALSDGHVGAIERGERCDLSAGTITALANALSVSPRWLWEGKGRGPE